MVSITRRALTGLNSLTEILCVTLLAAMMIVSGMQVFFRYVLLEPLVWSEEAARYLLIWLSFATAGLVLRENGNPQIEFISTLVSIRTKAVIDLVIQVLIAAFLFIFLWVSWKLAMHYVPYTSLATGVSQAWPRAALPIGGLLMLLNLLPAMQANWSRLCGAESLS